MRSKSKSTPKARSEQTAPESQPAGPSSSSTTNNSNSPPNPVEVIYNQFVSLGMPTDVISLTEFGRIYCPSHPTSTLMTIGSSTTNLKSTKSMYKVKAKDTTVNTASTLTQALNFISTHFVGRQEVRKRRALISQIFEEYSTRPSKLKAPSNFKKDSTEDIRTLFNNPKQTAQALNSSARRTLEAVQREWDVINKDMQILDIKHRTKKQELERARRVLFLLNVLEKREEARIRRMSDVGTLVNDLRKEADLAVRDFRSAAVSSSRLLKREGGIGLAKVRYRHVTETLAKLHRCHLRGQVNEIDRLDVVLGRLGMNDEDTKRKILQVARKRIRERLEKLLHVDEQKEKDVQMKINRVVALGFLCEGYLDYKLKDPEIQQQNGYIDKMRLAILSGEPSTIGFLPTKRVRVPERLPMPAITSQKTSYPVIPPFVPQINPNLSRKSDKSLHGFEIAADIEALVKQSMKLK